VYVSEPKGIQNTVDNMMDIALTGKGKLYFLTVNLHGNMVSETEVYGNDLTATYEAYKRREQSLYKNLRITQKSGLCWIRIRRS